MEKRLHDLEVEVKELLLRHASANVNVMHDEKLTPGDRMADSMANAAGSWRFIIAFLAFLFAWMAVNVVGADPSLGSLSLHPSEPDPFLRRRSAGTGDPDEPEPTAGKGPAEGDDRLRGQREDERLLEHLTA